MPTFIIVETCEYRVEAEDAKEALQLMKDHSPGLPEKPVAFLGVADRQATSPDGAVVVDDLEGCDEDQ